MTVAEPTSVRAGDTIAWTRDDLTDTYPAGDGWGLTYYLRNGASAIDITATPSGDGFAVLETAAASAAWPKGDYNWIARVAKAPEIHTVDSGRIEIKPDLGAAGAIDDRAHAEKVLAAIEAVIEERATKDQSSYTIGSRSLSRTPIEDLIRLRTEYRAEVGRLKREARLADGLGSGTKVLTRFV